MKTWYQSISINQTINMGDQGTESRRDEITSLLGVQDSPNHTIQNEYLTSTN